ncbi:MAG: tetratricopeptide repeat protein [Anaerolineae bacterium]|nr:tetratricopeptide repeat protein [Anaerolineae bacterium]
MRKILISILTIIFTMGLVGGDTSAQVTDSVSAGKLYVLQPEWIDVHTAPSALAPVATKVPQGFVVRVIASPEKVNGVNWWYITTSNYGWIPETIDGSPTLTLFSTELLEQTIAETTEILTDDPQNLAALFQRAMAYFGLKDFDASIADFDVAIEVDSSLAYLYGWRGDVNLVAYRFPEAEADFTKAIELDPTEAMYFIRRGVVLEQLDRPYDAEYDYQQASELSPTYAVPVNNIGNIRRYYGDYSSATSQYEKAMELDPHYGRPYYNRAFVKSDQGNYISALDDFTKAIQIDPYDPTAYNYRGQFLDFQFGNPSAAIGDFTRAIELDNYYAEAYGGRGIAYSRLENYELALPDFERAVELDPTDENTFYNLATAQIYMGDLQGSLANFNHSLELGPVVNVRLYLYRGELNLALGNYQNAVDDLTSYIEITTYYTNNFYYDLVSHLLRASAYAYMEDYEAAAEDLQYGVQNAPQFTGEYGVYPMGYRVVNNHGQRISVVEGKIAQNPNDASLYLRIANINLEAGRWDEALDFYEQYLALAPNEEENLSSLILVLQILVG